MSSSINISSSQIFLGDAIDLLTRLPSKSIRLLLTDPPYNISKKNNLHTLNRAGIDFGEWDKNFDQFTWIKLVEPALMPGASVVIWNDWKNLGAIASYAESLGLSAKRILTFIKTNPFPRNIERSFVQATEHALWVVKPGARWVFNKSNPYEKGVFTHPVQKAKHPTKKPDKMFIDLIKILSNEGDLVLDPFSGGGTTAYASEMTNRLHISFEKDPVWYEESLTHWKLAKMQLSKEAQ